MPYILKTTFQNYAWGDKLFIQNLFGLTELIGKPVAEMWLGAHPNSPSTISVKGKQLNLNSFLEANPQHLSGSVADQKQTQLPFLLKILAAGQPLSIQVHPDKATAEAGFAAENAEGIELHNPLRSFKDPNPKPELICALTEFTAMCGFRPYQQISALFTSLDVQDIWPGFAVFDSLPNPDTLKELYKQILDSNNFVLQHFIDMISKCNFNSDCLPASVAETCKNLNQFYPLDPGIVSPLLLNTFTLLPGQAVYLETGTIHAYIKGAG